MPVFCNELTKVAQKIQDCLEKEDFKTARALIEDLIYSLERIDKVLGSYLRIVNREESRRKRTEAEGLKLIDVLMSEEGY